MILDSINSSSNENHKSTKAKPHVQMSHSGFTFHDIFTFVAGRSDKTKNTFILV